MEDVNPKMVRDVFQLTSLTFNNVIKDVKDAIPKK